MVPRNVAPPSVVVPNVAPPSVAIQNVVIQIAVLVEIRVVLIGARILVLHAVLVVAVIQEPIPARDAQYADFHEAFREEFHAVAPKPAWRVG